MLRLNCCLDAQASEQPGGPLPSPPACGLGYFPCPSHDPAHCGICSRALKIQSDSAPWLLKLQRPHSRAQPIHYLGLITSLLQAAVTDSPAVQGEDLITVSVIHCLACIQCTKGSGATLGSLKIQE